MPLPVIADVYQAVLVWSNASAPRPATNIIHFLDKIGTQTEANLFTDLEASVTAAMWSYGMTASKVTSVQITALDGTSAGHTFTTAVAAKWAGGNAGHFIPQGAVVLSLKSNVRGPRGRNRLFLPWPAEAVEDDGVLQAGNVTAMDAAWTAFTNAMAAADWDIVAVSGLYNQANLVTTRVVRPNMKTQRRRARR